VATVRDVARIALRIAIAGSVVVAALLAASALGIWMEGANLHPTPRINALTVGWGMVPIPVLGWIVYVWTYVRPSGFFDIALRTILSVTLVVGAVYSSLYAFFYAYFVS